MPLMNVIFGRLTGSFTTTRDPDQLTDTINRQCLYMCKYLSTRTVSLVDSPMVGPLEMTDCLL